MDHICNQHDATPLQKQHISPTEAHPIKFTTLSPSLDLRQDPICFITDTYGVSYTVDTATNHIVVNGAKLITNFKIVYLESRVLGAMES